MFNDLTSWVPSIPAVSVPVGLVTCAQCNQLLSLYEIYARSEICTNCKNQNFKSLVEEAFTEDVSFDENYEYEKGEQVPKIKRSEILKEGLLYKQTYDGEWQQLWCVLVKDKLLYYQHRSDATECRHLGYIPVKRESVKLFKSSPFHFKFCFVVTHKDRDYYFACSEPLDIQEWKKAIKSIGNMALTISSGIKDDDDWVLIARSRHFEPTPFDWNSLPVAEYRVLIVPSFIESDTSELDPYEYYAVETQLMKLSELWQEECHPKLLLTAATTTAPPLASVPKAFDVYVNLRNSKFKMSVDNYGKATDTNELLQELLMSIPPTDSFIGATAFVLKVKYYQEYILENVRLSSLMYVRECLEKGQKVKFEAVRLPSYQPDNIRDINKNRHLETRYPSVSACQKLFLDSNSELRWRTVRCLKSCDIKIPFELKINEIRNFEEQEGGLSNLIYGSKSEDSYHYCIQAGLYFGGALISHMEYTDLLRKFKWQEWLKFRIPISSLPRETKLCITFVRSQTASGNRTYEKTVLGCTNVNLFNYDGTLKQGRMFLKLWPPSFNKEANPLGTVIQNPDPKAITLDIEFPNPRTPILHHRKTVNLETTSSVERVPTEKALSLLQEVMADPDPLSGFHPDKEKEKVVKHVVWYYRVWCCRTYPHRLAKALSCVNWTNPVMVEESYHLLEEYKTPLPAIYAMELLDGRFSDNTIRCFAVECLRQVKDQDLLGWLAQLVQVVKYEPYCSSALSEFLLFRGLRSYAIGHALFWYLQAELHNPEISPRFELMIKVLKKNMQPTIKTEFDKQISMVRQLGRISKLMKEKTIEERKTALPEELADLRMPNHFLLPFNPKISISAINIEKSRVMDSATAPLMLAFSDSSMKRITRIIFKTGDDLRTDVLMLQLIGMMDKIWKENGLDLHMQPYSCVCTGEGEGMIEVVCNAETAAKIQMDSAGDNAGLAAATTSPLNIDSLRQWLEKKNENNYATAVENLTVSCAGYCVATFILGIGDRHNDNIMVSENGNMFHIDFGFVLGNVTTMMGFVPRETAPFVLTKEMVHVMGGVESENFNKFVSLCCKAYNIMRKNAHQFLILLTMMLATGIEQLRTVENLSYVRNAFNLHMSDEEASAFFTKCIYDSLNNISTKINFMSHILNKKLKGK